MSAVCNGASANIIACHVCHGLYRVAATDSGRRCERCGARLHKRKPDSMNRCWAFLCAALVLYVPANIYPIMTVSQFGDGEADTILSGVIRLIESGMWPLALLVFVASVMIPVLKICAIAYLLRSVHKHSTARLVERARLYRAIEFIGRWSMVDIFMVSILIAIVRLGKLATIEPGGGAIAFAGVVVLTMLASMSFDPRMMWDTLQAENHGVR